MLVNNKKKIIRSCNNKSKNISNSIGKMIKNNIIRIAALFIIIQIIIIICILSPYQKSFLSSDYDIDEDIFIEKSSDENESNNIHEKNHINDTIVVSSSSLSSTFKQRMQEDQRQVVTYAYTSLQTDGQNNTNYNTNNSTKTHKEQVTYDYISHNSTNVTTTNTNLNNTKVMKLNNKIGNDHDQRKKSYFTFEHNIDDVINNDNLPFSNQTTCIWVHFDKKDNTTYNIDGWYKRVNYYYYHDTATSSTAQYQSQNNIIRRQLQLSSSSKNNQKKKINSSNNQHHNVKTKSSSVRRNNNFNKHNGNNNKNKENKNKFSKNNNNFKSKQELKKYKKPSKEKQQKQKEDTNNDKDGIYFIHIGKTGGSTLACNIQEARKRMKDECINYPLLNESTISKRITQRFHIKYPETDANNYIITIRNPIRRIQSWFLYEHSKNYGITLRAPKTIGIYRPCGQIMFNLCYETFHDFITYGLNGSRPYFELDTNNTLLNIPNVSIDIPMEQCKMYAWGTIQGYIASNFHNFWNYHRYTHDILQQKQYNKTRNITLYIIRSEYLWNDWYAIDEQLSFNRTNYTTPKPVTSHTNNVKGNITLLSKLPISNNSLLTNNNDNNIGLHNLCKALCDEIQYYKLLIKYGDNLSPIDKENSLNDLRLLCPLESSLEVRNCTY